ncbi:hypothetical protein, partial [uncultured Desulfovibrio sp.]|uniref:hypothetical protein n=1 Tax=uncultured Desulfovibrio sp. TaxID=167968 RepID=UPI002604EECB
NDRPYGLKCEAFQTKNALEPVNAKAFFRGEGNPSFPQRAFSEATQAMRQVLFKGYVSPIAARAGGPSPARFFQAAHGAESL